MIGCATRALPGSARVAFRLIPLMVMAPLAGIMQLSGRSHMKVRKPIGCRAGSPDPANFPRMAGSGDPALQRSTPRKQRFFPSGAKRVLRWGLHESGLGVSTTWFVILNEVKNPAGPRRSSLLQLAGCFAALSMTISGIMRLEDTPSPVIRSPTRVGRGDKQRSSQSQTVPASGCIAA